MMYQKLSNEDIIDTKYVTEISETTGEIIEYTKEVLSQEGQQKLIYNKNVTKNRLLAQEYIRKEIGRFFFYFYNNMDKIDMPLAHKTRFIYLSSFLLYDTEKLVDKISGEGNIYFRIKRDRLYEILNLPDKEAKKTITSLTKASMMYKDGRYYNISSDYSIHGKNNSTKGYTRIFIDNIRKLYNETDYRKHKQLYYLFKLLPYVNLENNIVCENIKETNIVNTISLTLKDIMNKLGLNETYSSKWMTEMKKFTIDDNYVIMRIEIDDYMKIIVNPRIYYAGSNVDNLNYIIGLFDSVKTKEK